MKANQAFTLVELLCTIAVMILLSAFVVPALQGSRAALVSTSSARLASLLESARTTAIQERQPVAVAMLSGSSGARFVALKYVPSGSGTAAGGWKQISKWESLPEGVIATGGADGFGNQINAFLPSSSPQMLTALPSLVYSGTTYYAGDSYGYVVFLPDGSLYQADGLPSIPCILRIAERKNSSGSSSDFCDIVVNEAAGTVKIVHPEDEKH
jgi:Tfp pilus assembly protein FimT